MSLRDTIRVEAFYAKNYVARTLTVRNLATGLMIASGIGFLGSCEAVRVYENSSRENRQGIEILEGLEGSIEKESEVIRSAISQLKQDKKYNDKRKYQIALLSLLPLGLGVYLRRRRKEENESGETKQ